MSDREKRTTLILSDVDQDANAAQDARTIPASALQRDVKEVDHIDHSHTTCGAYHFAATDNNKESIYPDQQQQQQKQQQQQQQQQQPQQKQQQQKQQHDRA